MEGVEVTPPRGATQEGLQAVEGNIMQVLFSMMARIDASIQGIKRTRRRQGRRTWS